jgi:NMD protein affecting ribosome stability and mRNA decay
MDDKFMCVECGDVEVDDEDEMCDDCYDAMNDEDEDEDEDDDDGPIAA